MHNITDLSLLVHQDSLLRLFLIPDPQIYGFPLKNVGYHYLVGLMLIIAKTNHHHMLPMDQNGK